MLSGSSLCSIAGLALSCLMQLPWATANWDPATGTLPNYKPTDEWLASHQALKVNDDIQVSECVRNTRLHFPHVQLYALFEVDHSKDKNHGCPYGRCSAYIDFPQPEEMVVAPTHAFSSFWHSAGGLQGLWTHAITNPINGAMGYEVSLSGKYIDGPVQTSSMQLNHDQKWSGFNETKLLAKWKPEDIAKFPVPYAASHPKCGRPCGENLDPGSRPGAYGNYQPAPASAYPLPAGFVPRPEDNCNAQGPPNGGKNPKNGSQPTTGKQNGNNSTHTTPTNGKHNGKNNSTHSGTTKPKNVCKKFCACLAACDSEESCVLKCDDKDGKCCKDNCPKPGSWKSWRSS